MAGKSVSWRHDQTIQERLLRVERLHLAKWSNRRIAAELSVDEKTIRKDLAHLSELWLDRTSATQDHLRAEALAKLEDVRVRALEAAEFDERMEWAVLTNESLGENGQGELIKVHHDDKGGAQFRGNKSAALNVARAATMDQAKIQGIVVDKVSPTNPDGTPLDLAALILKARADDRNG